MCRQSSKEFEWLIIDDGSTDYLKESVKVWEEDARRDFPLTYVYQENGGKHRAWNRALPLIKSEWTFVVDSDDYLTDDAIEKALAWITQIEGNDEFAGVSGKKGEIYGTKSIGDYPKGKKYVDSDNFHRHSNHLTGDMAEIYRTSLLREYPFPEYEGEKFIAENAVYGRIARTGRKLRWFPDVIYRCEYREDGLTKGIVKETEKYFNGFAYMVRESEKYNEFPSNYAWIGRFAEVAKRKGMSLMEGCRMIEVPVTKYILGIGVFLLLKLRDYTRK